MCDFIKLLITLDFLYADITIISFIVSLIWTNKVSKNAKILQQEGGQLQTVYVEVGYKPIPLNVVVTEVCQDESLNHLSDKCHQYVEMALPYLCQVCSSGVNKLYVAAKYAVINRGI